MKIEAVFKGKALCGMSAELVRQVVFEAVTRSGVFFAEDAEVTVGVASVSLSEIQRLNKTYRKKDTPTDVLSFSEYADRASIEQERGREIFLGDVLLSCDVVERQAREDGVSIAREGAYLLAHGVLHLLGYDHEPRQFSIQDEICAILSEATRHKKQGARKTRDTDGQR